MNTQPNWSSIRRPARTTHKAVNAMVQAQHAERTKAIVLSSFEMAAGKATFAEVPPTLSRCPACDCMSFEAGYGCRICDCHVEDIEQEKARRE